MDKKLTLNFSLKAIVAVVIAFILGFALSWWSPWSKATGRTVTVTGESTLTAAPDEYIFTPYYQASASNRTEATTAVRNSGDKVVAKLKDLGVPEAKIKTDITAYDFSIKPIETETKDEFQATYSVTVTINNSDLAQKVFDYLLTTKSLGAVSPQVGFSDETQARLKSDARKAAVANARTQADEIAAELDQKITKAISVEEVTGFDVIPLYGVAEGRPAADSAVSNQTDFMPGEQDLVFTVKVVYGLR